MKRVASDFFEKRCDVQQSASILIRITCQEIDVRGIDEVLVSRNDLSPFLVHLTREYNGRSPRQNLTRILNSRRLKYGNEPMSVARYRYPYGKISNEQMETYFKAVSFTETPLSELHNLLDIEGRSISLSPYGLVFLRETCVKKGAAPVIYINNTLGDKDRVVESLCRLIRRAPLAAQEILPLVSFFGQKLRRYKKSLRYGEMDFTWEREWRYASANGYFEFDESDLFMGLCPHSRIREFEERFDWLAFMDPRSKLGRYVGKIRAATRRAGIKNQLV